MLPSLDYALGFSIAGALISFVGGLLVILFSNLHKPTKGGRHRSKSKQKTSVPV